MPETPMHPAQDIEHSICESRPDFCTVVAAAAFSSNEPAYASVASGQTILEMIGPEPAKTCHVSVGGHPIDRALWGKVRPKAGSIVYVTVVPQGGGGSKVLRTVALAVLAYYSAGLSNGTIGATTFSSYGAVAGSALLVGGTLALNALIPPVSAATSSNGDPYSQSNSLTGSSNQASPYGYVPCTLGQVQMFPPHAALPYTEISGNDQYLRLLLDFGYGDLDVSDIKIGDTSIDDYDDVDYEITTTPTLFTQDIFELQVGTVLNTNGDIDQRTSQNPTNELSVDLTFPSGLFGMNSRNKAVSARVMVDVLFRKVGTDTWYGTQNSSPSMSSNAIKPYNQSIYQIDSNTQDALRVGLRWKVPEVGQYEVSVRRSDDGWDSSVTHVTDMTWSTLRSISSQNPSTTGTLKLAVRIKATDQLNGVVSTLSALVTQKVRTYDKTSGTFTSGVGTKNPAWIYLWLLTQCPAVARRLTDDRLDLNEIATWAAECDAKGLSYCATMDEERTLGDWLRDVLAAGRASFGQRNGKYSPVRDLAQTVPVQMFTPVNSWGFSWARAFDSPPHALKVKFTNPEAGYQEDMVVVYWNGYNAGNATVFEELDLRMVDDPNAVWRLARYHLAAAWLRPTQYVFSADIEHMVCERGDLVSVAHDVTEWGLGWGRIKAVSGKKVTLDQPIELVSGKTYAIRVRRATNVQVSSDIDVTGSGITWDMTTFTFDSTSFTLDGMGNVFPVLTLKTALSGLAPGDLFVIGETGKEVAQLIIKSIEPGDDLSAKLTCVDAAPGVWTADAGTPPTFTSQITGQPWCSPPAVPKLNIRIGTSTPNDAGLVRSEVGISADAISGIYRMPIRTSSGLTIRTMER